jgi:transposase
VEAAHCFRFGVDTLKIWVRAKDKTGSDWAAMEEVFHAD